MLKPARRKEREKRLKILLLKNGYALKVDAEFVQDECLLEIIAWLNGAKRPTANAKLTVRIMNREEREAQKAAFLFTKSECAEKVEGRIRQHKFAVFKQEFLKQCVALHDAGEEKIFEKDGLYSLRLVDFIEANWNNAQWRAGVSGYMREGIDYVPFSSQDEYKKQMEKWGLPPENNYAYYGAPCAIVGYAIYQTTPSKRVVVETKKGRRHAITVSAFKASQEKQT